MTIFTDKYGNIKALGTTDDTSLTAHDVDRKQVFGDWSDTRILCYRYVPQGCGGYMITPVIPIDSINAIDASITPRVNQADEIILNQLVAEGVIEL